MFTFICTARSRACSILRARDCGQRLKRWLAAVEVVAQRPASASRSRHNLWSSSIALLVGARSTVEPRVVRENPVGVEIVRLSSACYHDAMSLLIAKASHRRPAPTPRTESAPPDSVAGVRARQLAMPSLNRRWRTPQLNALAAARREVTRDSAPLVVGLEQLNDLTI